LIVIEKPSVVLLLPIHPPPQIAMQRANLREFSLHDLDTQIRSLR
jgi:hypothetical protein